MRSDPRIVGRRFGKLVAMVCVGRGANRNAVWEFLCDCGAPVRRAICRVRYRTSIGEVQMCRSCRAKRGWEDVNRPKIRRFFSERWARLGDLWSGPALEKIREDVRRESGVDVEEDAPFPLRALDSELWPNGASVWIDRSDR